MTQMVKKHKKKIGKDGVNQNSVKCKKEREFRNPFLLNFSLTISVNQFNRFYTSLIFSFYSLTDFSQMLPSRWFQSVPNADDAHEWRLLGFRARAYVQISASLGMSVALIGWSFHCQPIIALDTSS